MRGEQVGCGFGGLVLSAAGRTTQAAAVRQLSQRLALISMHSFAPLPQQFWLPHVEYWLDRNTRELATAVCNYSIILDCST